MREGGNMDERVSLAEQSPQHPGSTQKTFRDFSSVYQASTAPWLLHPAG
jgi:hypothetical protein